MEPRKYLQRKRIDYNRTPQCVTHRCNCHTKYTRRRFIRYFCPHADCQFEVSQKRVYGPNGESYEDVNKKQSSEL